MKKLFRYAALTAVLGAVPASANAGELKLTIVDGHVTLIAHDVTVREILAEWARIGQTKVVNGEKLIGPPVTLELEGVPESKALETILRSAAGYVVAPRMTSLTGPSNFESIVILATSRAPAVTQIAPSPFVNRPTTPQPMMPQVAVDDDDDDEPEVPSNPPGQQPGPGPVGPQFPGPPTNFPGATSPSQGQPTGTQQGPMTLPRPGQLPQPATPNNPYVPGQPQPPRPNPGGVPRPGGGSGGI
jgi:translation initiation factor IF-2